MKIPAAIFLLSISIAAQAQFKITPIIYKNEKDFNNFSFPFIEGHNTIAANTINNFLQTDMLESTLKEVSKKNLFNKVRYIQTPDSLSQSGYTSMDYEILLNTKQVFTIRFDNESMGAYPEYWKRYYCFENATGKHITPDMLFSSNNKAAISKLLMQKRDSLIQSWMKEMMADYGDGTRKDSAWIAETFRECNADAGISNFVITKNGLLFYKEYCFPHVVRPYDTNLDIEFSTRFLLPFLSTSGKKYFQ